MRCLRRRRRHDVAVISSRGQRRRSSAAQPQEEFHVARRAGQRAAARRRRPASRARRPRRRRATTASARSAGSRTTPPAPSRSRPTSNCGLTIGSRSPSGAVQAASAGSTSRQRDERQVGDGELGRPADRLRRERPDVRPVEHRAPARRCAATRPAGRSRRRPRPPRAAPRAQQHVGEAAGRRAGVQAAPARAPSISAKAASAPGQLVPAPGGVVGIVWSSARTRTDASGCDAGRRLGRDDAAHLDPAGGDQRGRVLARRASPRRTSSASSRETRRAMSVVPGSGVVDLGQRRPAAGCGAAVDVRVLAERPAVERRQRGPLLGESIRRRCRCRSGLGRRRVGTLRRVPIARLLWSGHTRGSSREMGTIADRHHCMVGTTDSVGTTDPGGHGGRRRTPADCALQTLPRDVCCDSVTRPGRAPKSGV